MNRNAVLVIVGGFATAADPCEECWLLGWVGWIRGSGGFGHLGLFRVIWAHIRLPPTPPPRPGGLGRLGQARINVRLLVSGQHQDRLQFRQLDQLRRPPGPGRGQSLRGQR